MQYDKQYRGPKQVKLLLYKACFKIKNILTPSWYLLQIDSEILGKNIQVLTSKT